MQRLQYTKYGFRFHPIHPEQFIHFPLVDDQGVEVLIDILEDLFPEAVDVALFLWELIVQVEVLEGLLGGELGKDEFEGGVELGLFHS